MDTFLSDIVEQNALCHADAPALFEDDIVLTWKQFAQALDGLRAGLAQHGVVRGSRVAILDRNSIDYVLLHYALAGMGAILVPVNAWYRAAEVAFVLRGSQPAMVVAGAEFVATVQDAVTELDQPPTLVARGQELHDGWLAWEALINVADDGGVEVSRPRDWHDPHMILYTSGTTGRPKGALITHRATMVDALSGSTAFGIRGGQRFLCHIPLFHTASWLYIKQYFMHGGAVVVMDRFDADKAVALIERHRCNGTWAAPLVLRQLIEAPRFATSDMSSMRLIAFGAFDPSDVMTRVGDAFKERGATELAFAHVYGLTEAGYVTVLRPEESKGRLHSVGKPVAGVKVALLDDDMNPVATGEPGEVCVQSVGLMAGYLNRPEETARAFDRGWLHTGDIGRMDAEGYLYIVDRKKDMIRTGGENVFAKEVEETIITHPAIKDCAVIGLPDADYDERVVAIVVTEDGDRLTEDEVMSYVRERIAGFKSPREVHFVDELPKTAAGKTAKHELKAPLLAKAAALATNSDGRH
jgi:fatty-acyl-CoA synthase